MTINFKKATNTAIPLSPHTVISSMGVQSDVFSVKFTFWQKIKILFSKTVWFEITKSDAARLYQGEPSLEEIYKL